MRTFSKLILLVFILVNHNAYAASNSKAAFVGVKNKKTLKKEYNHIALTPIDVAASLNMPDSVKQLLESEIIRRLEKKGYKVTKPQIMQSIRDNMSNLMNTSSLNNEQKLAVREHSYRELLYRHPVDAVVSMRVQAIAAPFQDDKAEWDGVSQKIKHKGDGLLKIITGTNYGGHIAASSLKITFWDRKQQVLYHWGGGIEVLMQRNAKKLEYLPASALWQKEKRVKNAIKLALKPL